MARSLSSSRLKKPGQVLGFYDMPGGKMECNNSQYSIVSMSMPGEQTAWAEAGFEEREAIHKKYRNYTHGLLWFLKSDPRVPESVRKEMATYGFCKDEWADNGHWPYYLYIRAARRMKGVAIMTQQDITVNRDKKDVIHIGSHFIDSHHVTRYAVDKDHFINEGRIWEKGKNFDIPYRAIIPKAEECRNLLVPVCVSSSAVAFCAIRLEPTWMHLGEVSGMAASLAIRGGTGVQEIDIKELQGKIIKAGIPLELPGGRQDAAGTSDEWRIDTTEEWNAAAASSKGISLKDGMVNPVEDVATFHSVVRKYSNKRRFGKMTLTQSPAWQNWEPIGKAGPTNIEDAPVFLVKGPGDYWLFGLYRNGWFTSDSLDKPFTFCGGIGNGHPDPDIGFAEGRFYLINQTASDYVSPGPWVESVEVRAGVDTTGDGKIDTWTEWEEVKESYDSIKGFSKQIKRIPAELDLSGLPAAEGFGFELRIKDTTSNPSMPILDSVRISLQ